MNSYRTASDSRVHFGLGDTPDVEDIAAIWPAGGREIWRIVEADRLTTLEEGSGEPRSDGG